MSDHLPITVEITVPNLLLQTESTARRHQVGWYKTNLMNIEQLYKGPIAESMHSLLLQNGVDPESVLGDQRAGNLNEQSNIESLVGEIVGLFTRASNNLPSVRYNKTLKPYWRPTLTKLAKEKKKARHDWITAGQPNDVDNPIFLRYK